MLKFQGRFGYVDVKNGMNNYIQQKNTYVITYSCPNVN